VSEKDPGPEKKPAPPATTTDLGRFPEKAETVEITSLLGGGAQRVGTAPTPAPPPPPPGKSVPPDSGLDFDPQIKIERKIGAGGMGEVFLGYQKHLDRKVAVKRIRAWDADAKGRERFMEEAKAQSRLQHPGIAQVYDFRESGDSFYLVMEYVAGKTLEELQAADEKFAPDRIARIGVQLTEALESAAHEGYIHRDLKPGNVMLSEDGKVKIIDFGLALRIRNLIKTRFTEKGDILGTPSYMSPEQLNQEENLDVRSDIWSLGVLLYALATGAPPFTGKDFACTLRNVITAEPAPLTTIEPGFPPALWQAIAKALKKDRAERWQDYASFRAALLEAGQPSERSQERETDQPEEHTEKRSSWGTLKLLGVAASTLFVVLLVYHILNEAQKGEPHERTGKVAAQKEEPRKTEDTRAASREALTPPNETNEAPPEKPKVPEPKEPKPPPKLRLRDRLIASPLSPGATGLIEDLLQRFARHSGELADFSYEKLSADLATLGKSVEEKKSSAPSPEDREVFTAFLRSAERIVSLARDALHTRLEDLRQAKGPVTLKLKAGGTLTGSVEAIAPGAITLKSDAGLATAVELSRISPEEFRPKASPDVMELAFQALSVQPSRTLPQLLEIESAEEEVFLWLPVVVRLARLEVEVKSRLAAAEAKPHLLANRAPENGTAALAAETAAKGGGEFMGKSEPRMPPVYRFLSPEFEEVKRELDALELLFHRQFSRAAARYPESSGGRVAGEVLLELFEKDLAAGSDELLEGSGWRNWRWELRPTHEDVRERRKYLVPKPDEEIVILQDEEGPHSLVMNDITSRAPEGVLLRLRLDPLGTHPDAAEWRFHFVSEKGQTSYLRVAGGYLEIYRTTLAAGAADVRLFQAPLPSVPVEQRYRAFAFVPGPEHLHVYVDRQLVLSIPREDGAIPKQLALVVLHGKLSVRNLEAKRALATDGGSRK
jgi:serine/threonine protein kinase